MPEKARGWWELSLDVINMVSNSQELPTEKVVFLQKVIRK